MGHERHETEGDIKPSSHSLDPSLSTPGLLGGEDQHPPRHETDGVRQYDRHVDLDDEGSPNTIAAK
jgi:hypothetical protein